MDVEHIDDVIPAIKAKVADGIQAAFSLTGKTPGLPLYWWQFG
jgi:hypothetical protein